LSCALLAQSWLSFPFPALDPKIDRVSAQTRKKFVNLPEFNSSR
jgi:hypothetical protein